MTQTARFGVLAAAFGAALLCARPAAAVPIYDGDPAATRGIQLSGWGSGTAVEARDKGYAGHPVSIRMTTQSLYSGGRLIFTKPLDLTAAFAAPDSRYVFLEFAVQFLPSSAATPPTPGGFPGEPGAGGNQQATPQASKFLRVTLVFDEGTVEAVNYPIVLFPSSNDPGWYSMPVSFVAFKGIDKLHTFHLRELRLFGDNQDEFYIGEIKTITDDEPITIDALENLDVAVNDVVQFQAQASAGISTLKYSWDFDASDGIQEDATGPNVTHVYRLKPAQQDAVTYTVTLTVSDIAGAKKPEKRTAQITVNP